MLQTAFPRFAGDIGNPDSFNFPVRYQVVANATVQKVVFDQSEEMLAPFIAAAQHLQAQGAIAISTSCGFLIDFQTQIQAHLDIPFVSSSLLALNLLNKEEKAAIFTFDVRALHRLQFIQQGFSTVPAISLPTEGHFFQSITNDRTQMNQLLCQDEVREAITNLVAQAQFDTLICECTNLSVHRQTIDAILAPNQKRAIHLVDLLHKLWAEARG